MRRRRRRAGRARIRVGRRQNQSRSGIPAYGWWAGGLLLLGVIVAVARVTQ